MVEAVMDTNLKGAIAEARVMAEATELGIVILRPSREGRRYDVVLDTGSRFLRAQVKWGRRDGDILVVRSSTSRHTPAGYVRTTYSADEIDGFAVYSPELTACLWLPIEEFAGLTTIHLRLAPARNNQRELVRWARDYPLGAVAQLGERLAGSQKVRGSSPLSSIE
jgi:hypothetical protein